MATEPDSPLSIVVTTHDNRSIIRGLLQDLHERVGPSAEVIVVDDSLDGTDGEVREFLSSHGCERWLLVRLESRVGVPEARNVGWKSSHGRYLLFLDSDVRLTREGNLSAIEEFVQGHPDVGVACPVVLGIDGRVQSAGVRAVLPGLFPYYPFSRLELQVPARPVYTFAPHGAAMLFRREALDLVGGFDETLAPGGYEELDLAWRVALAGFRTAVFPGSFVRHQGHATFGRLGETRNYYLNKLHQCRSVAKNAPVPALVVSLFVVPLVGVADDAMRFLRSFDLRFLTCTPRYLAALVGAAPILLRQRRAAVRSPEAMPVNRCFGKPVLADDSP